MEFAAWWVYTLIFLEMNKVKSIKEKISAAKTNY